MEGLSVQLLLGYRLKCLITSELSESVTLAAHNVPKQIQQRSKGFCSPKSNLKTTERWIDYSKVKGIDQSLVLVSNVHRFTNVFFLKKNVYWHTNCDLAQWQTDHNAVLLVSILTIQQKHAQNSHLLSNSCSTNGCPSIPQKNYTFGYTQKDFFYPSMSEGGWVISRPIQQLGMLLYIQLKKQTSFFPYTRAKSNINLKQLW